MLIPVIYLNGKHDMVKEFYLADLIEQKQILRFKRREGWVSASGPHIRQRLNEMTVYLGLDRRCTHDSGSSVLSTIT